MHVCMKICMYTMVVPKLLDAQNHRRGVWQVHLQYREPLLFVHSLLRLEDLCRRRIGLRSHNSDSARRGLLVQQCLDWSDYKAENEKHWFRRSQSDNPGEAWGFGCRVALCCYTFVVRIGFCCRGPNVASTRRSPDMPQVNTRNNLPQTIHRSRPPAEALSSFCTTRISESEPIFLSYLPR